MHRPRGREERERRRQYFVSAPDVERAQRQQNGVGAVGDADGMGGVRELGDFTLVECRLETGRTHQVRIHLAEAGTPLCGERVYDRPLHGQPVPDRSGARRIALHAATLGFEHPATGKRMLCHSSLPKDMADLVRKLKGRDKV